MLSYPVPLFKIKHSILYMLVYTFFFLTLWYLVEVPLCMFIEIILFLKKCMVLNVMYVMYFVQWIFYAGILVSNLLQWYNMFQRLILYIYVFFCFGGSSSAYILGIGNTELKDRCIYSIIKFCQLLSIVVVSFCNLIALHEIRFPLFSPTVYCQDFGSLPVLWVTMLGLEKPCETSVIMFIIYWKNENSKEIM